MIPGCIATYLSAGCSATYLTHLVSGPVLCECLQNPETVPIVVILLGGPMGPMKQPVDGLCCYPREVGQEVFARSLAAATST